MRIIITGGDGYCGWPTTLRLASRGHEVKIFDNGSRRTIAKSLNAESLTPVASLDQRLRTWNANNPNPIEAFQIDIARDYTSLARFIREFQPNAIVHLAAQRSAPYSMRGHEGGTYTLSNNLLSIHNVLHAVAAGCRTARIIHLGSIGVYGYHEHTTPIPEGDVSFEFSVAAGKHTVNSKFPTNPSSLYHTSKAQIAQLLEYFAKSYGLNVLDLYQGIVRGTQTKETLLHKDYINRFDYDEYYGTVVNRFIVQAASGQSLSVYGKGEQTRAFIHLADCVNCIETALDAPLMNERGAHVYHQIAETRTVNEVAQMVAMHGGSTVSRVKNPRKESEQHEFNVEAKRFRDLGLSARTLSSSILSEMHESVIPFLDRINMDVIKPSLTWMEADVTN